MPYSTALAQGRTGDRITAGTLALGLAAAVAIGAEYDQMGLALVGGGAIAGLALLVWRLVPGSLLSRLVLSGGLMSMVALHIQLGRGTTEFHFGVFLTLGVLLVYLDWRPIVLAAGLAAVHHVLFDRLQAWGWSVYCATEPSFLRILIHAGYVVAQTTVEVCMAAWMSRVALTAQASAGGLQSAVQQLRSTLLITQESVSNIETASHEMASDSTHLSERTELTTSGLRRATDAVTHLTHAVQESAQAAASANRVAISTADAAKRGGQVVGEVVAKMEEITMSSRRIGDITGVIDGIAFQTNILVLNAAVEAARAGEQGRGFAVVASEVRLLAKRSADAAREIKLLIGTSMEKIEHGALLVNDAGATMQVIVEGSREVAKLIGAVTHATEGQSSEITSVKDTVAELDQMTKQNADLVQRSSATADSLRDQAQRLSSAMASLQDT